MCFINSAFNLSDPFFNDFLSKNLQSCSLFFNSHSHSQHSFSAEGLKNLIRSWARIPLEQRNPNRKAIRLTVDPKNHPGITAIVGNMRNWVSEIKSEGHEFRNLDFDYNYDYDAIIGDQEYTLEVYEKKGGDIRKMMLEIMVRRIF